MPSGPVAFEISKDARRSKTSGSVQSRLLSIYVCGVLGIGITATICIGMYKNGD